MCCTMTFYIGALIVVLSSLSYVIKYFDPNEKPKESWWVYISRNIMGL